jgi:hypothetical protein
MACSYCTLVLVCLRVMAQMLGVHHLKMVMVMWMVDMLRWVVVGNCFRP